MELVAEKVAGPGQRTGVMETPVAERALRSADVGVDWEQARHAVDGARGIGESFSQHHVAPALAVDQRTAVAGGPKAVMEVGCRREALAMQFWIATGQENGISIGGWWLVRKRREGRN